MPRKLDRVDDPCMRKCYGVVWREGTLPLATGKLELRTRGLRLEGLAASRSTAREIAYEGLVGVRVGSVADQIEGQPTVILERRTGSPIMIATVPQPSLVGEIAKRLTALQLDRRRRGGRQVGPTTQEGCPPRRAQIARGRPSVRPRTDNRARPSRSLSQRRLRWCSCSNQSWERRPSSRCWPSPRFGRLQRPGAISSQARPASPKTCSRGGAAGPPARQTSAEVNADAAAVVAKVTGGMAILGTPGRYIRIVVTMQVGAWASRIASAFFLLAAFSLPASPRLAMLVVVLGGLSTLVPATPGGMGAQQLLLVYALQGTVAAATALCSLPACRSR